MPAWFAPALIQAQRADKYAATVKRLGLNPDEPIFNEVFRELSLYEGAFADHLAREVDALSESSS